ncbi:hypothetical protein AK812_SmicGene47904, partial [Symbiodinium microadriaticum]
SEAGIHPVRDACLSPEPAAARGQPTLQLYHLQRSSGFSGRCRRRRSYPFVGPRHPHFSLR